MKSISGLFYLALLFVLAISSINAQESDESRRLKAESADRHIRFISPAEFSVHINKGLWIILYGANWCKYTQKLTPKWLGLQTRIRAENLSKDINIAKVECTKDMDFCTSQGIDGFPTIYVYENGQKYEEYLGNHEVNEMFTFVQEQVARSKSEEVVEEVVTVYVEEVVYENEIEENKPRKSNKNDYEQQNQQQNSQQQQQNPGSKQLPKKRSQNNNNNDPKNPKNPPRQNRPNQQQQAQRKAPKQQRPPKNQQGNQKRTKQAPKYVPPKNAPPKYTPPKNYNRQPPYPPKQPNIVAKATKKVFGLVESLITLAVVLILIYIVIRFKAIKSHSSYSKSKIPLYRDLTQEEKFMLHYS
ncbi:thioredoxin-like protein [Piromyces finnis]|uniref:Thioredoxin-like protein n=1 Tax=Piromyces finnis TaxID=1754191 RepID=A0A1Y1VH02_9FUNG|nr:thioredoxin-like protein [Piromyces finnis]|eukprot:ORX54740.1 thioredoxin-like protein [Piromyces finnis]